MDLSEFPFSSGPLLLIVSGPAGSGKTTLVNGMMTRFAGRLQRVITATTRPPRAGERDGMDYHFLDRATFASQVAATAFYEWATVHGHCYGTLKNAVNSPLRSGMNLILNIDVQGAATFRRVASTGAIPGQLVSIFITPPNLDELRRRMGKRGLDEQTTIEKRLYNAKPEIAAAREYDYGIPSRSPQEDLDAASAIYQAELRRICPATGSTASYK